MTLIDTPERRLDDARLELELASTVLERALGRVGARVDYGIARVALRELEAILCRLRELLESEPT